MKYKGQKQFDEFNLISCTKYPNKSYGYLQLLIIINSHQKTATHSAMFWIDQ